jgi:hypothetical protein
MLQIYLQELISIIIVVDRHLFGVNPDPYLNFHVDADPEWVMKSDPLDRE